MTLFDFVCCIFGVFALSAVSLACCAIACIIALGLKLMFEFIIEKVKEIMNGKN